MIQKYNQEIFDGCMQSLAEKEQLLIQYLQLTKSITHENLVDDLEDMLKERQTIISQLQEIDKHLAVIAKKPFGNEALALTAVLKHKTPEDTNLPPILQPIDKKCKIIYNILCSIKEADEELSTKVQFVRENVLMQIEQVNNNKRIFGYNQTSVPIPIGNVLDKKQ